MFGLKFERAEQQIEELHSNRIIASQIRKKDDNQIISRVINNYVFKDEADIKSIDGPPPYWAGIIPGDESTYRNPITEPINSHYLVRTSFTIEEYSGYLMYGQPIENIDQLRELGQINDDFIDPNTINLYKGWFQKDIEMHAYDYYVPLRTGTEFRWEVELIQKELTAPDLTIPRSKVGGYPTDNFEEKVNEQINTLENDGYTVTSTNNLNSKIGGDFEATITAVKNIYNTGGVKLVRFTDNTAIYEIDRVDTGVAIRFTIKNCKAWFSTDGVEFSEPIFTNHLGKLLLQSSVTLEKLKLYKYLIVQPNLVFSPNTTTAVDGSTIIGYPPVKFTLNTNEGFNFIAEFLGRHYLHFKEEIVDISDTKIIPSNYTDFENPEPSGVDLPAYSFIDEDSEFYWDAKITL